MRTLCAAHRVRNSSRSTEAPVPPVAVAGIARDRAGERNEPLRPAARPATVDWRSGLPSVPTSAQTSGQLTTSDVFLSVTSPAAWALLIWASDLRSRFCAPAFQLTSTIAHSGG